MRMSAEWNHDQILQLIEYYKQKPVIWDPSHNYYHVKNKKNDAWHDIAAKFHCDIDCVKSKMASLLSSYRREKAKMMKLNGKTRDEGYESNWFAFKSFSFLSDKYKPRETYDNDTSDYSSGNFRIKNEITEELTVTPDIIPETHKYLTETLMQDDETDIKRLRLSTIEEHELKNVISCESDRDECSTFGEHVGFRLRKLSNHARAVTIRKISTILCKADIGCYE